MKPNHEFFYCTYSRVFFSEEKLKTDANVTNFGLSKRLNIVKFISVKIISLLVVKNTKGTAGC